MEGFCVVWSNLGIKTWTVLSEKERGRERKVKWVNREESVGRRKPVCERLSGPLLPLLRGVGV